MAKKLCTPFCDGKKPCQPHHELLVALLNCSDQRCASKKYANMDQFEQTVKRCIKKGWKREDDVPDSVVGYQFPLIHWSCVLGKCQATQWMIENGFNPTVCSQKFQETALHRCVLCLHYTVNRRYEAKVERIVDIMKDCLLIGDADQDTPLHVCAKQLLKGGRRDFYGQTLERMITKAQEMRGLTTKILDAANKDGNTILHILARSDCAIIQLRKAIEAGGSADIRNKNGMTPLEVAVSFGNNKSVKLLRVKTINQNTERERRKKENQKYLDRNTFVCDSVGESSNSAAHAPTDSDDESLATMMKHKGLPVKKVRVDMNGNDALSMSTAKRIANQRAQQDGSDALTDSHTHDAVDSGGHDTGDSDHDSFSDNLDKRISDGCHNNDESDVSGSPDKGGDKSVVNVTSSQGDDPDPSRGQDDRETDTSDNHGSDGSEASGNCDNGAPDNGKGGSDSGGDSYHDNDTSATDGNPTDDSHVQDPSDDDTIPGDSSGGGEDVTSNQREGGSCHANDATATNGDLTDDNPANEPCNDGTNTGDGDGSDGQDVTGNHGEGGSCYGNDATTTNGDPTNDSPAHEPCDDDTITGDVDGSGGQDVTGNHGEGGSCHGNDATATNDDPTNDNPAHVPCDGNMITGEGRDGQNVTGNKDEGDSNTIGDDCDDASATGDNHDDDSPAHEPCNDDTITGDGDDDDGAQGEIPDCNGSQDDSNGAVASAVASVSPDDDADATGDDPNNSSIVTPNSRADSSSNNEMPLPCSSSNIEGQMSNGGDDDDDVTICKIKMEPPDLEFCTCCCQHYHTSTPSACSCSHVNLSSSISTEGGSSQDNTFITLLQGAGLLKNVKEMAASLRAKDEQQLLQIKNQKQSVDAVLQGIDNGVGTKTDEIYRQTQKLEQLQLELDQLKVKKETELKKRKRLDDEDNELAKKLRCCDDLLKVVPNGNQ